VVPALRDLRQEDGEFQASLGYTGMKGSHESTIAIRILNTLEGVLKDFHMSLMEIQMYMSFGKLNKTRFLRILNSGISIRYIINTFYTISKNIRIGNSIPG
jgi:hypothetical protein